MSISNVSAWYFSELLLKEEVVFTAEYFPESMLHFLCGLILVLLNLLAWFSALGDVFNLLLDGEVLL